MFEQTDDGCAEGNLTFRRTCGLIRSDFNRLVEWYGGGTLPKRMFYFFLPNYYSLFLYRLYRHLYVHGWRNTSRLLFLHSLYTTGVEISPTTSIGPGCLITHAFGVIIFGKIGARFSVFGQAGTGGGLDSSDIGGGPGYPVVGDDVVFGIKAVALGPIRIGNRVRVGPAALVTNDIPDDATVVTLPSKTIMVKMPPPVTATKQLAQPKNASVGS